MRRFVVFFALSVALAACGGATIQSTDAGQAAPPPESGSTQSPVTSEGQTPSSEPAPTQAPVADGPPAADFTLALGDGGSYTLSDGAKPVYLVFWAEW